MFLQKFKINDAKNYFFKNEVYLILYNKNVLS